MYFKVNRSNSKRKLESDASTVEVKKMEKVVCKGEVEQIIRAVHEEIGHLMQNNTYAHVKERFYWDTVQEDVRAYVTACEKCQKNRPFKDQPAVLRPVPPPNHALSHWGMDLMKLPESDGGFNYLIVAIDHLTKWSEAQPIKTKSAADVLCFFEDLCMRSGYRRVLITDQGREFCNKEMGQFCNTNGIDHRVTSAYCPQSNGLTERTKQTIKNGLRKALEGRRKEWPRFVNRVLYGIRLHRPRSTKESPYKLLYGFDARISLDNKLEQLNQPPDNDDEVSDDAEERRLQLFLEGIEERNELVQASRAKARENIKIEQSKQKTAYDIAHAPPPFKRGSKVLLHSSR
ncbi:hypothetical protein Aduo_014995 [Ancylostoma duodenale]